MKCLTFNFLMHLISIIGLVIITVYVIAALVFAIINNWYEILHHVYTLNDMLLIIVGTLSIVGFILVGCILWGCNNENFK